MSKLIGFVALRQLLDRKFLNTIAVLGVALGVLTLIVVRGMLDGMQQKFLGSVLTISPHVTILDKRIRPAPPILETFAPQAAITRVKRETPSERQLRIQRADEIVGLLETMPGVQGASSLIVGSAMVGLGAKQASVELRGIDQARQERVTPLERYITAGSARALSTTPDGVVLGADIAESLGAQVGDVVSGTAPLGQPVSLKVVGIFACGVQPVDASRAYVSLKNAEVVLGMPDFINRIEVKLHDPDRAPAMTDRLENMLGYDAESWQEQNANFLALFKQNDMTAVFIISAILAVGGFGILAIQFMIILQKTRDIALMRSVGFRRLDIVAIFLIQGAIVALLGATLGSALGHALVTLLGGLKVKMDAVVRSDTFLVHDDPRSYVYGFVFSMLTGFAASLFPAYRASRVEPVDVLRGQVG